MKSQGLISQGNIAMRDGNFSLAILRYLMANEGMPALERIIEQNIALTLRRLQSRERNKVLGEERVSSVWLFDGTKSDLSRSMYANQPLTGTASERIACYCGSDVCKDISSNADVAVKQRNFSVPSEENILESAVEFATQNPYELLFLEDTRVPVVILGLVYKLLWNSNVRVVLSDHSKLAIEEINSIDIFLYLEAKVSDHDLVKIALSLNKMLIDILCKESHQGYLRLRQTRELFINGSSEEFLEKLFSISINRKPTTDELAHFGVMLESNQISRAELADVVFAGDEYKRHTENTSKLFKRDFKIHNFTLPKIGDIQPESIAFPYWEDPMVSIIIPVYGKLEYTLACLHSIAENLPRISFEVLVLDDRSPDNSADELTKVNNIKVIVNPSNLGFLRSCNNGAKHAKGRYICILNNDIKVLPNWLDELVDTFVSFPNTGFVGSKLIYPNGTLQEAGAIIWQDGSAWNYGRNEDPARPIFNYAREVDYCSGASIILPTALFRELGGFSDEYAPAYCEDSDLALKVRNHGSRVIYQPMSVVVHYEGVTHGTDESSGVKSYQVENAKKLFNRWTQMLKFHQPNGVNPENEKDRMAARRVLVLDHCTPTPDQDAGSVTVFNLLLLLREMGFQVTFIPEDNFLHLPPYTTVLQRVGVEVLYAPYNTTVENHLIESGGRYDLAFLFRPGVVERNIKRIRKYCPKAKVLFHTVDLHFLRMQREADLQNDAAKMYDALEMKQREFSAIRAVDASIVHSTAELELLRPELPSETIHVFPLIMDVPGTNIAFSDRLNIVFVGGYQHTPNVDAVHYFVSEVMPLLRMQLKNVCFYVVGSKPPEDIKRLASEDVVISGFVEDLNSLLDTMRISVAPLRYGAGIKGKIGTAMAAGLPVVATSLAAEGMSLTDGENILIADGAEAFASTITSLYKDEILWNRLSAAGSKFADQTWGAEAAWEILAGVLNDLGFFPKCRTNKLPLYTGRRLTTLANSAPATSHTVR